MCSVDDPADRHLESLRAGFLVYVMISPPLPSPGQVLRKWLLLLLGMVVNIIVFSRVSGVQLFVTLWTLGCYSDAIYGLYCRQAPLSMGFSRQEYWSGLPYHLPGDLPDPGIEPVSPALAGGFKLGRSLVSYSPWGPKESDTTERLHFSLFFTTSTTWEAS